MFVRYFVELPLPHGAVEAALLRNPGAWVQGLAQEAEDHGATLLAEVGFGDSMRVERTVAIELAEPIRVGSKIMLPLRWTAAKRAALFPKLEADVEVAGIGPNRTQLSITGRYDPPLGAVGRAIDKALLHRIAEATIKDFLDRIARRIEDQPPEQAEVAASEG
ncbi:MAG TPA: hypothetical protein VJN50_08055 [Actinomycetota bacterium]|nr:hypothetical protein [Actinomycetota bacterium]